MIIDDNAGMDIIFDSFKSIWLADFTDVLSLYLETSF